MKGRSHFDQHAVSISPSDLVERNTAEWRGVRAEFITATQRHAFEWQFKSHLHLLVAIERSERTSGQTLVSGVPPSTRRNGSGTLTLVPAGYEFSGSQQPRVLLRISLFYIDPFGPLFDPELHFAKTTLRPQLIFFDPDIWRITTKLKDVALNGGYLAGYSDALISQFGHELV